MAGNNENPSFDNDIELGSDGNDEDYEPGYARRVEPGHRDSESEASDSSDGLSTGLGFHRPLPIWLPAPPDEHAPDAESASPTTLEPGYARRVELGDLSDSDSSVMPGGISTTRRRWSSIEHPSDAGPLASTTTFEPGYARRVQPCHASDSDVADSPDEGSSPRLLLTSTPSNDHAPDAASEPTSTTFEPHFARRVQEAGHASDSDSPESSNPFPTSIPGARNEHSPFGILDSQPGSDIYGRWLRLGPDRDSSDSYCSYSSDSVSTERRTLSGGRSFCRPPLPRIPVPPTPGDAFYEAIMGRPHRQTSSQETLSDSDPSKRLPCLTGEKAISVMAKKESRIVRKFWSLAPFRPPDALYCKLVAIITVLGLLVVAVLVAVALVRGSSFRAARSDRTQMRISGR